VPFIKNTPGITVNPILMMNGTHSFNEVFLDDVRIPVANRLGEENEGWKVTLAVMNFERFSVGDLAHSKRNLEELVGFCKETKEGGTSLIKNPHVKHRLVDLFIECEVARVMVYKTAWLVEKGELHKSMAPASAAKLVCSEFAQRLAYEGLKIMGLLGQVKEGSKWSPLHGSFEHAYQLCMAANIAAGTSEIQKNLIAWTAMGLPRK